MAALKMYMSNAGNNRNDPQDLAEFENMLDQMEAKYTDVSYTVDFTMRNGERALDCSANSKQDAENIC